MGRARGNEFGLVTSPGDGVPREVRSNFAPAQASDQTLPLLGPVQMELDGGHVLPSPAKAAGAGALVRVRGPTHGPSLRRERKFLQ